MAFFDPSHVTKHRITSCHTHVTSLFDCRVDQVKVGDSEPSERFSRPENMVFKTAALNRSATFPRWSERPILRGFPSPLQRGTKQKDRALRPVLLFLGQVDQSAQNVSVKLSLVRSQFCSRDVMFWTSIVNVSFDDPLPASIERSDVYGESEADWRRLEWRNTLRIQLLRTAEDVDGLERIRGLVFGTKVHDGTRDLVV